MNFRTPLLLDINNISSNVSIQTSLDVESGLLINECNTLFDDDLNTYFKSLDGSIIVINITRENNDNLNENNNYNQNNNNHFKINLYDNTNNNSKINFYKYMFNKILRIILKYFEDNKNTIDEKIVNIVKNTVYSNKDNPYIFNHKIKHLLDNYNTQLFDIFIEFNIFFEKIKPIIHKIFLSYCSYFFEKKNHNFNFGINKETNGNYVLFIVIYYNHDTANLYNLIQNQQNIEYTKYQMVDNWFNKIKEEIKYIDSNTKTIQICIEDYIENNKYMHTTKYEEIFNFREEFTEIIRKYYIDKHNIYYHAEKTINLNLCTGYIDRKIIIKINTNDSLIYTNKSNVIIEDYEQSNLISEYDKLNDLERIEELILLDWYENIKNKTNIDVLNKNTILIYLQDIKNNSLDVEELKNIFNFKKIIKFDLINCNSINRELIICNSINKFFIEKNLYNCLLHETFIIKKECLKKRTIRIGFKDKLDITNKLYNFIDIQDEPIKLNILYRIPPDFWIIVVFILTIIGINNNQLRSNIVICISSFTIFYGFINIIFNYYTVFSTIKKNPIDNYNNYWIYNIYMNLILTNIKYELITNSNSDRIIASPVFIWTK
jgi:hypothetical protein